jgi:hypothetical protein
MTNLQGRGFDPAQKTLLAHQRTQPANPTSFGSGRFSLSSLPAPALSPAARPPLLRRIFPRPYPRISLSFLPTTSRRLPLSSDTAPEKFGHPRKGTKPPTTSRCCDAASTSAVLTTTDTASALSPPAPRRPPRPRRQTRLPPPPSPSRPRPRTTSRPTDGAAAASSRSSRFPRSPSLPRARSTSPPTTSRRR